MNTENKLIEDKGFWRAHSAAWKSSGLTQQAYCEQKGISFRSFLYQHNRLAMKSKKVPQHFVEAKPEASASNSQLTGLHLLLPNGVRIGVSSEVNPRVLQAVLNLAGSL